MMQVTLYFKLIRRLTLALPVPLAYLIAEYIGQPYMQKAGEHLLVWFLIVPVSLSGACCKSLH